MFFEFMGMLMLIIIAANIIMALIDLVPEIFGLTVLGFSLYCIFRFVSSDLFQ